LLLGGGIVRELPLIFMAPSRNLKPMKQWFALLPLLFSWCAAPAQVPENLVAEGVPSISDELKRDAGRYLEFRTAAFQGWHPTQREMLIATRFADAPQLHLVRMPGGDRSQLTFTTEPVSHGLFQPKTGKCLVYSQDTGGGEFFQLYRYDLEDGKTTLLTDGKSRNTGMHWAKSGKWLAYTSTRRTGRDNDIYIIDPLHPSTDRLFVQVSGGGWAVEDWSHDGTKLLLKEYISINESYLHVADIKSGKKELITQKETVKIAYDSARFSRDGNSIFLTTDKDSEFQRLFRLELSTHKLTLLTAQLASDVEEFELSPDGQTIALIANEKGAGVLHLVDAKTGKELRKPKLPLGIVSGAKWHENGRDLGFNLSSAKSPADAYALDVTTGRVERWTQSETGGLNPTHFVEPVIVPLTSFDGVSISAIVYRPDPAKFPGKRPALISIHGGPESQSRPGFQARNNYYLNELGIAIIYPNVRGSAGFGKTYLELDNGFKREDSVKDIGTVIDWARKEPAIDAQRLCVMGGSYGGYMVLASMIHYNDLLRCGVDVVGISNFLTFLRNTQEYRRDLRRAEYGDERDEKMRQFLEKVSPTAQVQKIKNPLFVVQGKNDPRVPVTEAEQMVKALRENGGRVWYLMAKDEGHGFGKKRNIDYQFLSTVLFLRENLLN
jgi:dipeptidyl aminopeptidase/acylaminoacyl peptidase